MVIVPVLAVSGVYFQMKLVVYHRQVRERNSQITGAFNEGITGAKTTKTLVIEDRMETEFDNLTGEMKARERPGNADAEPLYVNHSAGCVGRAGDRAVARRHHHTRGCDPRRYVVGLHELRAGHDGADSVAGAGALEALTNVQVNVERFTKLMETESDVRDTPEVVEKYGDSFHPKKENWEPLSTATSSSAT